MKKFIVLIMAIAISHITFGQTSHIKREIDKIIENKNLKLGFALYDFSNGDTLSIKGDNRFPMQSVFKFPIALAVLNEVDNKKLELNQNIFIREADLHPNLWSPLREKYPQGNVWVPLSEVIKYTVSQSDNIGCDLLLKTLDGALVVNKYIHGKGVTDIRIQNNEQEIQSSWEAQFDNWATPKAIIQLLMQFNNKELLLPDTHAFLWDTMAETSTGSIKNKLPKDVVIAHKTGTSGYNKEKVSAATNDVGIMLLSNGKQIAFAIFITDSKEPAEVNADVIADIAVLLYYSE